MSVLGYALGLSFAPNPSSPPTLGVPGALWVQAFPLSANYDPAKQRPVVHVYKRISKLGTPEFVIAQLAPDGVAAGAGVPTCLVVIDKTPQGDGRQWVCAQNLTTEQQDDIDVVIEYVDLP